MTALAFWREVIGQRRCRDASSLRPCRAARTFGFGRRFYGMSDTAVAAKKTVEVGQKQIFDQCLRIGRQLRLIARHERDGYPDLVADAIRMLAEMERALARMRAHHKGAGATG